MPESSHILTDEYATAQIDQKTHPLACDPPVVLVDLSGDRNDKTLSQDSEAV